MRIVFMGTPDFAVPALEALVKARHEIVAVYTQPPRPAGRGHKIQKSPVHICAEQHGFIVHCPVNFKDDADKQILRDLQPDLCVVAAYGLLLPQSVLDIPKHGCINIHGSLLPRWRGAAPIHRALLAGDAETGITIMRMEKGLDTGPMLLKGKTDITPTDTTQTLHDRLSIIGAELMVQVVNAFDHYPAQIQPKEGVTYAHKLEKGEGDLKGTETAQDIDKMVRALNPWPGVWLDHNGQRLKILEGFPRMATSAEGDFGQFLKVHNDIVLLCGKNEGGSRSVYQVTRLQTPNGKQMDVASAINGGVIQCHG